MKQKILAKRFFWRDLVNQIARRSDNGQNIALQKKQLEECRRS